MPHNTIIEFTDCPSEYSTLFYSQIKNYYIVYKLRVDDERETKLMGIVYDTVIILNNPKIKYSFAYSVIEQYIKKHKEVIIYYPLTKEDQKRLKNLADQMDINIFYYAVDEPIEIFPIKVPVIYITGMGMHCDQLGMHLNLCNILKEKKFNVLNYSNSIYSNLFDFYNVNNLKNMNYIDAIKYINNNINSQISKLEPDVIIISDSGGLQPYNAVIENDYGCFNNILKYACPYDYVLYNMYAVEYEKVTLDEIVTKALYAVDKETIYLGLGHITPTMAIAGLSDNDDFIEVIPDEYNKLLNNLRLISDYEVIDTRLRNDLEMFIKKINND